MAKRTYRGCTCGCGNGTYGNYAPGHDAKHVAKLVAYVIESWADGYGGETSVRWQRAIKQLPTEALQGKFRARMVAEANKTQGYYIREMDNDAWQRSLYLAYMVNRVDTTYGWMTQTSGASTQIAEVAAAMGLTRHGVNYRQS